MDYLLDSPDGVLVPNEPVIVAAGPIYLKHHHDSVTVQLNPSIFTGLNQSLQQITDYTVHNDSNRPWRKYITFGQTAIDTYGNQTVYLNYTSTGDYVDDIYAKSVDDRLKALEDRPIGGGSGLPVQVVSVTPLPDSIDIEVNAPIYATINKWLDDNQEAYMKAYPSALDRDNNTNSIGTVERYNNKTLRLTHVGNNFEFTSIVYVRIFAGLTAIDGMTLENNYDFSFQTASAPPNDDPIITYFDIKSGTMLRTGVTLEWDYSDTESNPITSIEIYEDGVLHGTMTSAGNKNGNGKYEIVVSAVPNYNYNSSHDYYIKVKDGYNDWTVSSTVTVNIPANQAPTTPTITASIDNGGDITFRVTNSPITDNESDTMTATIFVDGVALTGYTNVPFTSSTWSTNTVLDTNFALSTNHTIRIEIYDGYNTVSSNTVSGLLVQTNQAPTLTVSVSGTTTVGSTLTATRTVGTDPEGDTVASTTWEWLMDDVVIAGQTVSTKSVVEADVGKTIKARATVTMSAGANPSPTASAGTLIPVPAPPSLSITVGDTQNTLSYTNNATLTTETYNLYWLINAGTPTADTVKSTGTKITGITSPYTHSTLTNGQKYNYVLTMVVNGVESTPSAVVYGIPSTNQAPVASNVNITGTTILGSTLTGSYTVTDAESDTLGTHTFRWLRDNVAISGATATTYILVEADFGKTIKFEVTPKATTGSLTGTPVTSSGTLIPVPAPPSLNTPTQGNGKITNTFTQNATLATETYFAIYTTDGSTPTLTPINGTRVNGVTSPFDITSATTVKVALGMTVNGQDSVLSAVVSGTPLAPAIVNETFTGTDGTLPAGFEIVRINNVTQGAGGVIQLLSNQLKVFGQHTLASTWINQLVVYSTPIDMSTDRTFKLKIATPLTGGTMHFRIYETKPNNSWDGIFPTTLSRTFGLTIDTTALYKQYYDATDTFINQSVSGAGVPSAGTVIEFRYHKAANTFDIYYDSTAKATGLAIKSGWTQGYLAIGVAAYGTTATGVIVDDLIVI